MQLPSLLLKSLQEIKGFKENAFTAVHHSGEQVTSVRTNPLKVKDYKELEANHGVGYSDVPWCSAGFYLSNRPSFTFDPLFHAGCYYVQEASSMFLEHALLQSVDLSAQLKVLDLCGAPGGKSTHLLSLVSANSLVVCNEVIRSRAQILKTNVIKWGSPNAVVTNNDPKDFARLKGFFDVVVTDAPCSGSGLFRRDETAIEEWSENNVTLCSQRQQRILADILPALKENGILIYSTCSYSKQEDEDVLDWLCKDLGLQNIRLQPDPQWNITEVETSEGNYGYRFWPHLVKGEGFFITVLMKLTADSASINAKVKTKPISKSEAAIVKQWINDESRIAVPFGGKIYLWPENLFGDFDLIAQNLNVIYSGTLAGEIIRDKFLPDHALAMSPLISDRIQKVEWSEGDAIAYLQRKDIQASVTGKGWQLADYKRHSLGWVNILPNRINNYYPKELRILKENKK